MTKRQGYSVLGVLWVIAAGSHPYVLFQGVAWIAAVGYMVLALTAKDT